MKKYNNRHKTKSHSPTVSHFRHGSFVTCLSKHCLQTEKISRSLQKVSHNYEFEPNEWHDNLAHD